MIAVGAARRHVVHEKAASVWNDPLGTDVIQRREPGAGLWPGTYRLTSDAVFLCLRRNTILAKSIDAIICHGRRRRADGDRCDQDAGSASCRQARAAAIRRRQTHDREPAPAISTSQPADGSGTSELPKPRPIAPYSTIPVL